MLAFKNGEVFVSFWTVVHLSLKNLVIHESDVRSISDKAFDCQDKLLDTDVLPHPCITKPM